MTAEERIAQIAQGFGQGIQNFQSQQGKQEAQALQEEARRRQQAMQEIELAQTLGNQYGRDIMPEQVRPILSGGSINLAELLASAPQSQKSLSAQNEAQRLAQKQELDHQKTIAEINKLNRPGGQIQDRAAIEFKKEMAKSKIPDFDIADPTILPSAKDAEEVKKMNVANKNFINSGNKALSTLEGADRLDATGFTKKGGDFNQNVTEMKLQAKELANLGVLNGPDLKIVEDALGAAQRDMLIYGPEVAKERIAGSMQTAIEKLGNTAGSRGYSPKNMPKINYQFKNQAPANMPGFVNEAQAADPDFQEYQMLLKKAGQ